MSDTYQYSGLMLQELLDTVDRAIEAHRDPKPLIRRMLDTAFLDGKYQGTVETIRRLSNQSKIGLPSEADLDAWANEQMIRDLTMKGTA